MFATALVSLVAGTSAVEPLTVNMRGLQQEPEPFNIRPCSAQPKPYFCFVDGNTKNPAECPPPSFDAAHNFTLDMLKEFVNAPWYIQYQAPVSYKSSELFCEVVTYEPEDTLDITAGADVFEYGNSGLNGPVTGNFRPEDMPFFTIIPDASQPNKVLTGPKFLRPLPDFEKYYSERWVLAAGGTHPTAPSTGFEWAIAAAVPPAIKSEAGPGCRVAMAGDEEMQPATVQIQEFLAQLGTEGMVDSPLDSLVPLLFELGYDNIEKLLAILFAPVEVKDFDLAGGLKILDTLDLRPVLELLEDPAVDAEVIPFIEQYVGEELHYEEALASLQGLDTTAPVSLSQVLAAVADIEQDTLQFFLALAPQVAEKEIKTVRDVLRGVIIEIADAMFGGQTGEGLWLMTRDAVAPQELTDQMLLVTRKLGLDINVLIKVVQDGCEYEGLPEKEKLFDLDA